MPLLNNDFDNKWIIENVNWPFNADPTFQRTGLLYQGTCGGDVAFFILLFIFCPTGANNISIWAFLHVLLKVFPVQWLTAKNAVNGNDTHRCTWSLALSSGNFSSQWTHWPSSLSKTEFASRFLQNPWLLYHTFGMYGLCCALWTDTQNQQKLYPHGNATSASKKGLSLKKMDKLCKSLA